MVLERSQGNNLFSAPNNCQCLRTELEFFGLVVGKSGITVDKRKTDIIKDWPRPKSISEVRSSLGLVQFFRSFIRNFSGVSAPLANLAKKEFSIKHWKETSELAFEKLKESTIEAPILQSLNWQTPFRRHIYGSQTSLRGKLTQLDKYGNDRVIVYHSKKLPAPEMSYSANDRELLGIISFLKRFRCYLEGAPFDIFPDNQVLKYFFTKPKLSRREV